MSGFCGERGCYKPAGHEGAHTTRSGFCGERGCYKPVGHEGAHTTEVRSVVEPVDDVDDLN